MTFRTARADEAADKRVCLYAFSVIRRRPFNLKEKQPIVISEYNKTVDEVYLGTASRMLERDSYLQVVLSYVNHAHNLPSLLGQQRSRLSGWDDVLSVR